MTTRHLIDPELLSALEMFPPLDLSESALPAIRARAAAVLAEMGDGPPVAGVVRSERLVPGPAGGPQVRVLLYAPEGNLADRPAMLHIHGGGYIIGMPEMADARNRSYVAELGCVIVSVDYRLAPETRFPGAVEDCYAALKWLHDNAPALGVDVSRIAISGESAGGGLAASLTLLARDRGEVPILFSQLIYPMIDDRTDSSHPYAGEFVWDAQKNRFGWTALLGSERGGPDVSPYAAAARAEDLSGLPPTFISVGGLDLFLEENLAYARRLLEAGVPTELHVYPGAYHGFERAPAARVARQANRDYLESLRAAFRPQNEAAIAA